MRIAERKESPIIGLTGIGGGLASYILYGGSGSSVYEISRSLRFSSDDSAYLSDTPTYTGDRRRFTWTSWVKEAKLPLTIIITYLQRLMLLEITILVCFLILLMTLSYLPVTMDQVPFNLI